MWWSGGGGGQEVLVAGRVVMKERERLLKMRVKMYLHKKINATPVWHIPNFYMLDATITFLINK